MPTFTPPSHQDGALAPSGPFRIISFQSAPSVVRVDGTFTTVRSPSGDLLTEAGEAGTDYFLGGRTYVITDEVAAELTAAGYTVTEDEGYGEAPFGSQGYGD